MATFQLPALLPPPGVRPNYVDPQSQALMVVISCILCLALIVPISLLRFYTNIWIKSSFKVEECICAFAVAGSVAYTAVVLSSVNITGIHQWNVPINHDVAVYLQKMIIVIDLMYGPVALCAKLSLLFLYYRLFSCHRWIRHLTYVGIGLTLAMYTAGTAVYGYLCLPHHGENWLQAGLSSRCHRQFIMIGYVRGPFNLASDLFLLILPLPAVWQLHMPLRKKVGIFGIFLTGSFACIASIFGMYFRVQLYRSQDLTWNLAPVLTTLVIELNTGTICACLPFLATFYQHHRLKPEQVAAIRNITSRMSPFTSSQKALDHRLGTHILGSAQGEGKFFTSRDPSNVTASITASEGSKTLAGSERNEKEECFEKRDFGFAEV